MCLNDAVNRFDPVGFSSTKTEYYSVEGPYYRLAVALGPGEWGEAKGVFDYVILKGKFVTKLVWDDSCPDCYRRETKRIQGVRFYVGSRKLVMPKWTDYDNASQDEQKAWDDMIDALTVHEQGHFDIYDKYDSKTTITGSGSDCLLAVAKKAATSDWLEKVKTEHKSRTKKLKKETLDYDEETQSGMTQGVSLPQI